jgi:excisionase family DNA binding protein
MSAEVSNHFDARGVKYITPGCQPGVPGVNQARAPILLTLDQVAAQLGVSKSSVEEWVRTKSLASFKVGRLRKVSCEELARFILANTVRSRRPDWMTDEIESEFLKRLRHLVDEVVEQRLFETRNAECGTRNPSTINHQPHDENPNR